MCVRKSFVEKSSLVNHLRSSAHMTKSVRCPRCLRHFADNFSLAQHAESQSLRCRLRESDDYGLFVDKLTGGIADLDGHHDDGTVKYKISKRVEAMYVSATVDEQKVALDADPRPHLDRGIDGVLDQGN
jgi:hypothetical protein